MTLSELKARVDAAVGGDRELDAALVTTLCPEAQVGIYVVGDDEPTVFHAQSLGIANKSELPAYTSSLDAALGLVEAKLPGWGWAVSHSAGYRPDATLYGPTTKDSGHAKGATPSLALLSALLAALMAEEVPA